MCMLWLVRTSSLYFYKAHTLHHTNALLRYTHSLCHRYEHAQFVVHFLQEIKTCSLSTVELYKHLVIFKKTREVQEALTLGSCFSTLLFCS